MAVVRKYHDGLRRLVIRSTDGCGGWTRRIRIIERLKQIRRSRNHQPKR